MSSKYSSKNIIKEEFHTILHDLTKEIIRYQPKDILDFAIKYFHCLENNIPLQSIIEQDQRDIELTIKEEQNSNQKDTISSTIKSPDKDIIKDKNNELLKNIIDSNNSTPNNNNTNNNSFNENNELEETLIKVPISKEMEELFKEKEEENKKRIKKERPLSAVSDLSDSQKREIKDFVSDLFFDVENKDIDSDKEQ